MSDNLQIDVFTTIDNIDVNVVEASAASVGIEYFYPKGDKGDKGDDFGNTWGGISGTLVNQVDLWRVLSAKAEFSDLTLISASTIPTVTNYLSTTPITLSETNTVGTILSAGVDLFDIFTTSETESQELSYSESNENISITHGNTVSLSALSYRNESTVYETIEEFTSNFVGSIHPGYNVTLHNERVYTFAGTDKNNPSHYLEINANPYLPIYREISLNNGNEAIVDSFYLGDFKTAKYNLQIETNFNNEIYYSELNVVGSVQSTTGVAIEYGQAYTSQLILGYDVHIIAGTLHLKVFFSMDNTPGRVLLIKGHRTNFYKI